MIHGAAGRPPVRGLASLRKLAQRAPAVERCDLCAAAVPPQHQHLIDPQNRRLLCACAPCALLFPNSGQTKYRLVPRDVRTFPEFHLDDAQWNSLAIPIGLVFLFRSSLTGKVSAVYPSPAGPTETQLADEDWDELAAVNPALHELSPDVEALLVNRVQNAREYYIAPIDRCYELTGLIRTHWRGFSGGEDAWTEIHKFFAGLREHSYPVRVSARA